MSSTAVLPSRSRLRRCPISRRHFSVLLKEVPGLTQTLLPLCRDALDRRRRRRNVLGQLRLGYKEPPRPPSVCGALIVEGRPPVSARFVTNSGLPLIIPAHSTSTGCRRRVLAR